MPAIHASAMNLMAQRGEATAMQRAIDQGADINATDKDWFPLMMAVAVNQARGGAGIIGPLRRRCLGARRGSRPPSSPSILSKIDRDTTSSNVERK